MMKRHLRLLVSVVVTFVPTSIFQPLSYPSTFAQQPESCRTFPETGKTVCGKFLVYWQRHGGLAIFGYPIGNPFTERSDVNGEEYTVQYFERALFELHPENRPPHDVLLSHLGMSRFRSKYAAVDLGEPNEHDLPVYPNARNIKVERFEVVIPDEDVINTTTFETIDRSEAVNAFYAGILLKNGWQYGRTKNPGELGFVYVKGTHGPVYGLSVQAKRLGAGASVVLSLYKTLPK